MQVCYYRGPEVNPDRSDTDPKSATAGIVSEFIRQFFKGVSDVPSINEQCLYTVSLVQLIIIIILR